MIVMRTTVILLCGSVFICAVGCTSLDSRLRDLEDCFKANIDYGLGASLNCQVSVLGLGLGYWEGRKCGLIGEFDSYDSDAWFAGIGLLGGDSTHRSVYVYMLGFCLPSGVFFPWDEHGPKLIDAFWVSISFRLFLGFEIGFNPGEFLDFLLGFFGLDLAGDDDDHQRHRERDASR
jgi:hypothetical protein